MAKIDAEALTALLLGDQRALVYRIREQVGNPVSNLVDQQIVRLTNELVSEGARFSPEDFALRMAALAGWLSGGMLHQMYYVAARRVGLGELGVAMRAIGYDPLDDTHVQVVAKQLGRWVQVWALGGLVQLARAVTTSSEIEALDLVGRVLGLGPVDLGDLARVAADWRGRHLGEELERRAGSKDAAGDAWTRAAARGGDARSPHLAIRQAKAEASQTRGRGGVSRTDARRGDRQLDGVEPSSTGRTTATAQASPLSLLEEQEEQDLTASRLERLRELLAELPPEEATVLVEKVGKGASSRELAQTVGVSDKTVSNMADRAMSKLRDRFGL